MDVRPALASALPACRAYLTAPTAPEGWDPLATAATELVEIAAAEHGKDISGRRPVTVDASPTGPHFTESPAGSVMVIASAALSGDYRMQVLYQAAHEAAHVAISSSTSFTWADEMFAVWFAWRALQALNPAYAEGVLAELWEDTGALSVAEMTGSVLPTAAQYPEGLYGRAFFTGLELTHRLGWQAVRALARPGEPPGTVSVDAWLGALDPERAATARSILQCG